MDGTTAHALALLTAHIKGGGGAASIYIGPAMVQLHHPIAPIPERATSSKQAGYIAHRWMDGEVSVTAFVWEDDHADR